MTIERQNINPMLIAIIVILISVIGYLIGRGQMGPVRVESELERILKISPTAISAPMVTEIPTAQPAQYTPSAGESGTGKNELTFERRAELGKQRAKAEQIVRQIKEDQQRLKQKVADLYTQCEDYIETKNSCLDAAREQDVKFQDYMKKSDSDIAKLNEQISMIDAVLGS